MALSWTRRKTFPLVLSEVLVLMPFTLLFFLPSLKVESPFEEADE